MNQEQFGNHLGALSAAAGMLRMEPTFAAPMFGMTSMPVMPGYMPPAVPASNCLIDSVQQENVDGTTYFIPTNMQNAVLAEPMPFQSNLPAMYVPMLSLPAALPMEPDASSSLHNPFFMSTVMRRNIMNRVKMSNLMLTNSEMARQCLPSEVGNYHSLYPLEATKSMQCMLQLPAASTYRATHKITGTKYCLRRLHNFLLPSADCLLLIDKWSKLKNANVVQLCEIFSTESFGDQSLVLVYKYHAAARTLMCQYFKADNPSSLNRYANMQCNKNAVLLPESTIWSIIMQLTSALNAIHKAGLASNSVQLSKVITTGKQLRLSCCACADLAQYKPNTANADIIVKMQQQHDLSSFGRLILCLATKSLQPMQCVNAQFDADLLPPHYSMDLRKLVACLLNSMQMRTIADLLPLIGERFFTQLNDLQNDIEMQQVELAKELDNGRLYRILVKLNCIVERSELGLDPNWAETGDRYLLKLFRDYVFHAVTEHGRPWLDHAHILNCLNKLDAGCLEKVQLMTRDEETILIVSYAELKNCLNSAFDELLAHAIG